MDMRTPMEKLGDALDDMPGEYTKYVQRRKYEAEKEPEKEQNEATKAMIDRKPRWIRPEPFGWQYVIIEGGRQEGDISLLIYRYAKDPPGDSEPPYMLAPVDVEILPYGECPPPAQPEPAEEKEPGEAFTIEGGWVAPPAEPRKIGDGIGILNRCPVCDGDLVYRIATDGYTDQYCRTCNIKVEIDVRDDELPIELPISPGVWWQEQSHASGRYRVYCKEESDALPSRICEMARPHDARAIAELPVLLRLCYQIAKEGKLKSEVAFCLIEVLKRIGIEV